MNRAFWKVPRYARQSDPLYTNKPFDRWHAWQDVVARCNALAKPYTFMVGNNRASLKRGQCFVSDRNLAHDWGWGKSTVGRFLRWLVDDGRITLDNQGRAGTILTVCNFTRWQGDSLTNEAENLGHLRDGNRDTSTDAQPPTTPTVTPRDTTPAGTPHVAKLGHAWDNIKKYKKSRTTAAVDNSVDNCGQLSSTAKAARVYEAFRLASGNLTRPPSQRETRAIKAAIAANDGTWEPIRDMVRDSCARAIARGDSVRSVTYGLAAWKNEQEEKLKLERGKLVPVLSGLVGAVAGSVASPSQGRPRPGAVPEGRPGDGVTEAEREAVKRVRRKMGMEE